MLSCGSSKDTSREEVPILAVIGRVTSQGQQAELKPEPLSLLSRPVSPSATAQCGWTPAPQPSAASWRPP